MGGTDKVGVIAELVVAAANAGVYTYEAAPVATLLGALSVFRSAILLDRLAAGGGVSHECFLRLTIE